MTKTDLISREAAVREELRCYLGAREAVRRCREAEDDFGTLAFEGQKEAFRWTVMVLMTLPAADTDVGGKDNNVPTKEQNEPLTIQQLREMDGEPVWLDVADGVWALVDTDDDCVWLDRGGSIDIFRLTGKAYRRPPEGNADA